MSVDLNALIQEVAARLVGSTDTISFEATAGQILKLETSPSGEEIALGVVPAGKKWIGKVVLSLEQVDM